MNFLKYRDRELDLGVLNLGVTGVFTMRAFGPDGKLRRERKFKNLVTNIGLNNMGLNGGWSSAVWIYVGTGTAAPDPLDTSLANFAARVNPNASAQAKPMAYVPGPPDYMRVTITVTSAIGFYAGNITEVGISTNGDNSNALTARALILDPNGNPTSFPIFADEQLAVTYEFRIYPPQADKIDEVSIGSTPTTVISRAAMVATSGSNGWDPTSYWYQLTNASCRLFTGPIRERNSFPGGTGLGNAQATPQAYAANSYMRDHIATFPINNGNGVIRSVQWTLGAGHFQAEYNPTFTKTSNDTMTLRYRVSWGRYVL